MHGPVALKVPRGRVSQPDGPTTEFESVVLPRYARRTGPAVLSPLSLTGCLFDALDRLENLAPVLGFTTIVQLTLQTGDLVRLRSLTQRRSTEATTGRLGLPADRCLQGL